MTFFYSQALRGDDKARCFAARGGGHSSVLQQETLAEAGYPPGGFSTDAFWLWWGSAHSAHWESVPDVYCKPLYHKGCVDLHVCEHGSPSPTEFSFFDPSERQCREVLFDPNTTIPELFAVLRQWVPQVQKNIDLIGNEVIVQFTYFFLPWLKSFFSPFIYKPVVVKLFWSFHTWERFSRLSPTKNLDK